MSTSILSENEPSRSGAVELARLRAVFSVVVAVLCGAVVLYGQDSATQRQDSSPQEQEYVVSSETSTPAAAQEELISPDDQLEIFVMDVPELSRQYRVSPAGLIAVPLLKEPITAAGMTTEQLAQTIRQKLQDAGMVNDPHVTAQVTNSRSHSITIGGAVKNPQIFPVLSRTTLLDAISQAGGLATDASETAIVARGDLSSRMAAPQKAGAAGDGLPAGRTVKVDLKRLMEEGDPSMNLVLYPGDRVTVQRAGVVYVVGAVNRAGGFVLANEGDQLTVLKAIALAQSIKSTAMPKKSVIIRKNANVPGGTEQIHLDLNKILEGHEPDQRLIANDILFVPDSARKKALFKAGDAAAQAASLMVYRIP
jgi:polysaccharide biosynthesis/export protein